jgi:hypothetical protein
MKAPRPIVVIAVLVVLALLTLPRVASAGGSGSFQLGYLVGSIGIWVILGVLYIWWYRRRNRA